MNRVSSRQAPNGGFTLLEVILAVGIFSLAAVALVQALNTIGLATIEASDQHEVDLQIKSLLNEYCFDPLLKLEVIELDEINAVFEYQVEIEKADLRTEEGSELNDMFVVRVTAFDKRDQARNRDAIASAQRIVNRKLWRERTVNPQ